MRMPHPGSRFYLSLCFRSTWGGFSPKIDVLAFLLCLLETTACLSSWSVPEDADSRGLGLSARLLVGLGLDSVQGRHPQEMEMQRGEGSGGSFPCFL